MSHQSLDQARLSHSIANTQRAGALPPPAPSLRIPHPHPTTTHSPLPLLLLVEVRRRAADVTCFLLLASKHVEALEGQVPDLSALLARTSIRRTLQPCPFAHQSGYLDRNRNEGSNRNRIGIGIGRGRGRGTACKRAPCASTLPNCQLLRVVTVRTLAHSPGASLSPRPSSVTLSPALDHSLPYNLPSAHLPLHYSRS